MKNGVYCIETPWTEFPSVEPVLSLVTKRHDAPFRHHIAGDPGRFSKHFECWADRDDWDYAILYLGFHGFPKGVTVAPDDGSDGKAASLWDHVRLDQIADYAQGRKEKWGHCMMHFASCSTIDLETAELASFIDHTGLAGVSGYTKDVEWMASLAFEILYMDTLLEATGDAYIRPEHLRVCRDRLTNDQHAKGLVDALGFRMVIKED